MLQKLLGPIADRWPWVRTALAVQARVGELHGGYLASAITLTAFLSLFPLLLVAVAIVGFLSFRGAGITTAVVGGLGLTGEAASAIVNGVATAERSRRAASVVGVAGLLWSGLGLVASLQYAWDVAWQITGAGLKDKVRGLAWLVGAVVILVGSVAATAVLNVLPGAALVAIPVSLVTGFGLWIWTHRVMTRPDIPIKALVPGAVLGAVGLEVLKLVGAVYVPRAVASSSGLYGSIGAVFALLAWLLVFGRLAVYSVVLNVVRWEEDRGTTTVEIEVPRHPGVVNVGGTRSGEAVGHEPTP